MDKDNKPDKIDKIVKPILIIGAVAICLYSMFGYFMQTVYIASEQRAAQVLEQYKKENQPTDLDNIVEDIKATNIKNAEIAENATTEQVVEKVMPAMVSITNYFPKDNTDKQAGSNGSGVIIGDDGKEIWITTNQHVVEYTSRLTVTFCDETTVDAYLKGYDKDLDIAVLSVKFEDISEETRSNISVMKMGNSGQIKAGESIICIGNSLGFGQSVTTGVISAVSRNVTTETGVEMSAIQIDAAINHGNSGGALINKKGELIGIPTAKNTAEDVENVGYVIPINDVKYTLQVLCAKEGRKPVKEEDLTYLGVGLLDTHLGVMVTAIESHSPAYKSNLAVGDIITQIDGNDIQTANDVKSELYFHKRGEIIDVRIKRPEGKDYVNYKLSIQLEKK